MCWGSYEAVQLSPKETKLTDPKRLPFDDGSERQSHPPQAHQGCFINGSAALKGRAQWATHHHAIQGVFTTDVQGVDPHELCTRMH